MFILTEHLTTSSFQTRSVRGQEGISAELWPATPLGRLASVETERRGPQCKQQTSGPVRCTLALPPPSPQSAHRNIWPLSMVSK